MRIRGCVRGLGVVLVAVGVSARPVWAHGFGQRYDLPVPFWLWAAGAAAAVVFSFVVTGLAVRGDAGDLLARRLDLLQWPWVRLVTGPTVRRAARIVTVVILGVVVAAGIVGDQTPTRNLAPTMVWVMWWVGFAYVSALVGNLWAVVNPWATIFDGTDALVRRLCGTPLALGRAYPHRFGVWPAVALFLAFAWVELAYSGRAVPFHLAMIVIAYSLVTWTGMLLFGRAVWIRHGDPFAGIFSLLARFAPLEARVTDRTTCERCPAGCVDEDACLDCNDCLARAAREDCELNLRPYGAGLVHAGAVTLSMTALVIALLSTVAFDGFTATPAWASLESTLNQALTPLGTARLTVIATLGLLCFPMMFAIVYAVFAVWMARAAGGELSTATVARTFILSLVPIAVAYHLAHYLTYLLIQGQLVIRLASDPFGFGWNVFGTASYRPDIGVVGARFAWYTAVTAIVLGHVIAVYLAHVLALRAFRSREAAIRSQYPMLVLMVGYTIVSLWILAQPIVESSPAG